MPFIKCGILGGSGGASGAVKYQYAEASISGQSYSYSGLDWTPNVIIISSTDVSRFLIYEDEKTNGYLINQRIDTNVTRITPTNKGFTLNLQNNLPWAGTAKIYMFQV